MKQLLPIPIMFLINFNSLFQCQLDLDEKVGKEKRTQNQRLTFDKS
jgi:hypothetical protein